MSRFSRLKEYATTIFGFVFCTACCGWVITFLFSYCPFAVLHTRFAFDVVAPILSVIASVAIVLVGIFKDTDQTELARKQQKAYDNNVR